MANAGYPEALEIAVKGLELSKKLTAQALKTTGVARDAHVMIGATLHCYCMALEIAARSSTFGGTEVRQMIQQMETLDTLIATVTKKSPGQHGGASFLDFLKEIAQDLPKMPFPEHRESVRAECIRLLVTGVTQTAVPARNLLAGG